MSKTPRIQPLERMARFRLAAHKFERTADGSIQTVLFMTKGVTHVDVATLPELEKAALSFGALHAPSNVWITPASKPTIRGFDKWNNSDKKFLVEKPAVVA